MPRISAHLSADVPADWFYKESMTLFAPDGQANVIASIEPLDPALTSREYAEIQGDLLRAEFPGYHEFGINPTVLYGGHQGYLRHFAWTPPDGRSVTQLQTYLAMCGSGYTATATTPTALFAIWERQLRHLLAGLRLQDLDRSGLQSR